MNVTVFGAGYVGLVSAAGLAAIGHSVICIDVDQSRIERLMLGDIPFYEPGLIDLVTGCVRSGHLRFTASSESAIAHGEVLIIGVGTPPQLDGSADLTHVVDVARTIGQHLDHFAVVVVKSTVPVGTSDVVKQAVLEGGRDNHRNQSSHSAVDFAVASNPEFLKEGDAVRDFMEPDRIVVGASDNRAIAVLRRMYAPLCTSPQVLMLMSERSSELCKYASNAMLATRISFMNEIAKLSDTLGADVIDVQRVMAADPRIGSKYLSAGAGFGGSCFPKDLRAIVAMGADNGLNMDLVRSVIDVNDQQQHVMIEKAKQVLGSLKGKRCAVWGLSFKPETDDIRDAPSLALIRTLLAEGATVVAHDPMVDWLPMFSSLPPQIFTIVENKNDALVGADILFLVTEWKQFRDLDASLLIANMNNPVIVDGRNLWHDHDFTSTSVKYVGIGRHSINIFNDMCVDMSHVRDQLEKLVS
ncbi:MAG: UDP-glucose/GDP-mannose dehydrogenase family protein [Actinobacteria bacterium]|nr:MAG: UDP-glucose/GDP-mannose dehydrogenase family protein [Actinomycetota bacterium]